MKKNNLDDLDINCFLNIIQGKKDNIVDYKANEKFLKSHIKSPCEFFYFENADHRFKNPGELEKIVEITTKILLKK